MQVETILPTNIQNQLLNSTQSLDPIELYINDLLDESLIVEREYFEYVNKRTILASQEIDRVNSKANLTNSLQLLRLCQSIQQESKLYQSIMKQIELYFNSGRALND